MMCARCQTELGIAAASLPQISVGNAPRNLETERDARELLARWSSQNLIDVPAPSISANSFSNPTIAIDLPLTNSPQTKPNYRFDRASSAIPAPSKAFVATIQENPQSASVIPMASTESNQGNIKAEKGKRRLNRPRIAESKDGEIKVGHSVPPDNHQTNRNQTENASSEVKPQPAIRDADAPVVRRRPSWTTVAGQLSAYAGVGLLTCGTVLVMWSYFGGPPSYMATGWIAAAIGQMFLFLGVVTLISSGMEQTIAEVTWRIDHLAEEIHHMGLSLDDLENEHRKSRRKRIRMHQAAQNDDPRKVA